MYPSQELQQAQAGAWEESWTSVLFAGIVSNQAEEKQQYAVPLHCQPARSDNKGANFLLLFSSLGTKGGGGYILYIFLS